MKVSYNVLKLNHVDDLITHGVILIAHKLKAESLCIDNLLTQVSQIGDCLLWL